MHIGIIHEAFRFFNINLINSSRKHVKNYLTPLASRYESNSDIYDEDIYVKEFFTVEMSENVAELLCVIMMEIEDIYGRDNIDHIKIEDIIHYFIEKYEKEKNDKFLQTKYPELKEIMDEYELKKRLMVDSDDL